MSIRAVIFDLMDVLLRVEAPDAWRAWEASAGVAEGALARAMFRSPRFREAIMGQVPERELWRDVAQTLGVAAQEPEALAAAFYSAFRLNTGLIDFIQTLRPRYKTAILTNTPSEMRTTLAEMFHVKDQVDIIIISAEEGVSKPQPELFQRALGRLSVSARESIFVDDEARYVAAAQALGMRIVQFTDNAQAIPAIERALREEI